MIKILRIAPDLEKEMKQGNLTVLKDYLDINIVDMSERLMYAKREETELYQGALRILLEVKDLLP